MPIHCTINYTNVDIQLFDGFLEIGCNSLFDFTFEVTVLSF